MGLQHAGVVASAIGGVAAMVVVLAMGALALVVVRRARRDDEPLFPELDRSRAAAPDPMTFTQQLAAGGTLGDDVTRVGEVASTSGFQQAYALLALVDGDTDGRAAEPVATIDPYAQLADIGPDRTESDPDPDDDDAALAAFVDGASDVAPLSPPSVTGTESVDTLLPRSRERRLRPRTA